MKKWEYKFIHFHEGLIDLNILNKEGENGWELVCLQNSFESDVVGILKRLIKEQFNEEENFKNREILNQYFY